MAGVKVRKEMKLDPKLIAILDEASSVGGKYDFTPEQAAFIAYAREKGVGWETLRRLAKKNGVGDWTRTTLSLRWRSRNEDCG